MLNTPNRAAALRKLLAAEGFDSTSRITPGSADGTLSFAQERLWLMDQLVSGSGAYNIPHALRFRGVLCVGVLERALGEVVRRHEVLRSRFVVVGGRPVVRVGGWGGFGLSVVDVSGEVDPVGAARVVSVREAREPFDVGRGPLVRGVVVRLGEFDHVLLLTVHHIVSDGWSSGVLAREVGVLYEAFRRGGGSPLVPLGVQYGDFAVWQRGWLRGEVLAGQLGFWRERLAGVSVLELPGDRVRPGVLSGAGCTERFVVSSVVAGRLVGLAGRLGVTLFMVLVAGFCAALCRVTGQDDIAIGTQIANRNHPEIENLIGFFVNTLVLRTDVSGDPTFRELLGRVRETALSAYAHQDLPFERLVQELAPQRDLAHGVPLFNVDLMLQNAPFPRLDLDDLQVTIEDRDTGTAKSDLGLMFWESNQDGQQELIGWYEYSTDLFEPQTVRRLVNQLLLVLEHATLDPDLRVSELPLMDEESRELVTAASRGRRTEPARFESVVELFERTARVRDRQPALVLGGISCDYRELDERANELAIRLLALGVRPDDRVAVFTDRSIEALVAVLGILKSGAAFAMIDTATPARRLTALLDGLAPRVVVTDGTAALTYDGVATVPVPRTGERLATAPPVRVLPTSMAYVMHTSGSTGTPKGVMIEHRGLANLTRWLDDVIHRTGVQGAPVASFNADFTSDAFIEDLCLLFLGATMHLPDAMLRRDPDALAGFIRAHGVQFLQCSPTQLAQLLERDLFGAGAPLRRVVVAGEAVSQGLWDRLAGIPGVEVWNVYGPTECTVDATAIRIAPGLVSTIGKPVDNVDILVLDSRGRLVPPGVRGEICIGGPQVGRGYAGRPRLTAEVFVPDPRADRPGGRLYRTGDIGSYRGDGTVAFHGRADHQVKLHGHRVELGEVESVLATCPGVADVRAVVGRASDGADLLVAYVVPHRDRLLSESADLVRSWEEVFDVQQGVRHAGAADFDLAGWNDTASAQQIADDEMRLWRDTTVRRILELDPTDVLEIGCGTGLLMFPLLPRVDRFVGVDISATTLEKLGQALAGHPESDRVLLHKAEAADLRGLDGHTFDTAVLNSVVQYFPTESYLAGVLRDTVHRIRAGGAVFLGDLRPRESLRLTHVWIGSVRGGRRTTLGELDQWVRRAVEAERELLVSPSELLAAAGDAGLWLDHNLHEGRGVNELVRFRYDAVVHTGPADLDVCPDWVDWDPDWRIEELVPALTDPRSRLGVRGVPNARVWQERALLAALRSGEREATIQEVLERSTEPRGTDPQDVFDLAEQHRRTVRIRWSPGREDGTVDIVVLPAEAVGRRVRIAGFERADATGDEPVTPTDPLRVHARNRLVAELQAAAMCELPRHMVPKRFVLLDHIPIDRAGKLDVRALPQPVSDESVPTTAGEPPSGQVETALAGIWEDLLGVSGVHATDDFFRLGGHSIVATRLVNRVNELFACGLSLRDPFERPVLRALAARIEELLATRESNLPLLPVLRRRDMPLSFAQERLWLMDQLVSGSGAYNIPHALRFRGVLCVGVLERALGEVVRRHEVLRSRFVVVGGRPVVRVGGWGGFGLSVVDVSGEVDPVGAARVVSVREAREPFDVGRGPLVRGVVVRLGEFDHVLLLTVHHIVSDGWSSGVLAREVGVLYEAFRRGGGSPLVPLGVQYGDFAVWQRGWLRGEVLAGQLGFWRERLAGVSVLELPGDRVRPGVLSGAGCTERFVVSSVVAGRLVGLAGRLGVTLFMVLVAGFCAALCRVTGQDDIAIGTAVSGRTRTETENLIGFFVNTLVLRTDVSGDPTFRELLGRVRETALSAYAHQDVPFDQVVQGIAREGNEPQQFIRAVLQIDESLGELPELDGVTVERWDVDKGQPKFPLVITVWPEDGTLVAGVEYAVDWLTRDEVHLLWDRFAEALAEMCHDLERPVGSAGTPVPEAALR